MPSTIVNKRPDFSPNVRETLRLSAAIDSNLNWVHAKRKRDHLNNNFKQPKEM